MMRVHQTFIITDSGRSWTEVRTRKVGCCNTNYMHLSMIMLIIFTDNVHDAIIVPSFCGYNFSYFINFDSVAW